MLWTSGRHESSEFRSPTIRAGALGLAASSSLPALIASDVFSAKAVALVAGVLLGLYAIGGFYTLDEQERGVVFRFGAVQNEVMQPGLRWRPLGVDSVVPVNTTRVFVEEHQAQMLTEDQNIVDVSLTVQYRIADPVAYVVNVREPRESHRPPSLFFQQLI